MTKHFTFLLFLSCISLSNYSQITPPYSTSFEVADNSWSHSPTFGFTLVDDWQRGGGAGNYSTPRTGNYAWCTNVNDNASTGHYSLETPSFNLSNTSVTYVFSFHHKYNFEQSGRVEYSLDNGDSWDNIDLSFGSNENWYNGTSFTGGIPSWKRARISLEEIQGNNNVKFRFRHHANEDTHVGWIIDDFEILIKENADIIAINGSYTSGQPSNKPNFPISMQYNVVDEFDSQMAKTYIYHSLNTQLDQEDVLIDSISGWLNINEQFGPGNQGYNVINDNLIQGGLNYIIYKMDVDNEVSETNEDNNIAYAVIDAVPVYDLPYVDDFEEENPFIITYETNNLSDCGSTFYRGYGEHQAISGATSGKNCWYANNEFGFFNCSQTIEFPFIDLIGDNNVVNFFYKTSVQELNLSSLYYTNEISSYISIDGCAVISEGKGWKSMNVALEEYLGPVFKLKLTVSTSPWEWAFAIDDLYVGPDKPDLSIQNHEAVRYTNNVTSTDVLNYYLVNSGGISSNTSTTEFFWSMDSIYDLGDTFLGNATESSLSGESDVYTNFSYSKVSQNVGEYYIIARLDTDDNVDEMREYNNEHVFKFYQRPIHSTPYYNDFESNTDDWFHYSDYKNDPIFWGTAAIDYPGINGKVIGIDDNILAIRDTRSRIHSPIFDLTSMTTPVLKFDLAMEDSNFSASNANVSMSMEFSTDRGATWNLLEPVNESFKRWYQIYSWYAVGGEDEPEVPGFWQYLIDNEYSVEFRDNSKNQSRNDDGTEDCILDISHLTDEEEIQFRYNVGIHHLDSTNIIFIDNFEIAEAEIDLTIDYVKNLYISPSSSEIELEYHIRNLGNYISENCTIRLLLSADSLLDASDVLLHDDIPISAIAPNQRKWFFQLVEVPDGSLEGKNYLLFDIDDGNLIEESDEENNLSFYRLKVEGIESFPSLFDFNEYQLHGWSSYNIYGSLGYYYKGHRFTNKIYYDNRSYYSLIPMDGQMNLDRLDEVSVFVPTIYLESPTYNLNNLDSVFISFNMSLVTDQWTPWTDQEGANFEYSLNGGNEWHLLGEYQDDNGLNWYNISEVGHLAEEPGWYNCDHNFKTVVYNATDILANHEDVTFRFKVRANNSCIGPSGLKLDNFRISEENPIVDLVAVNYGDTIDFQYLPVFAATDTVSAQVLNNSELIISSNVDYRWSTDSIFDDSDELADFITYSNDLPGQISIHSAQADYPYWSCDSVLYLVYRINSDFGSGITSTQVLESDYSNNDGYYLVNLIDHYQVLPPIALNFVEDQFICDGESITLQPSIVNNWGYYSWSDGSDESTLTVSESGDYNLQITSWNDCFVESNTVHVEVLFNQVEILHGEYPAFCVGDSLLISIEESGSATWSNGAQNTDNTYVYGAGMYSVSLTSPGGCLSNDSALIGMDFDLQPIIDITNDGHFCQDFALISAQDVLYNYQWNNGDTLQMTIIEEDGPYFYETVNSCGTYLSDTLNAEFHDLVADIEPSNMITTCIGDTINFNVISNDLPEIDWHYAETGNGFYQTIFIESFNYPNGPIPQSPDVSWNVYSADSEFLSKLTIVANDLESKPNGDSIVFLTNYIEVSNYYDIDLMVSTTNEYADEMQVYYEVDNGPITAFSSNGSVGMGTNILSEQNVFEATVIRIMVVFDGISIADENSQYLRYIRLKGYAKIPQGITLGNGLNYQFLVTGNDILIVEANNEFCNQDAIVTIDAGQQVFLENEIEVCSGINQTVCSSIINPEFLEISWTSTSGIVDVVDNCAVVNTSEDILLSASLLDGSPCPIMEQIQVTTTSFENTIIVNSNELTTSLTGVYQWVDCNTNLQIEGATGQSFFPIESGNYAVLTTIGGCTILSDCVDFIIDGISELRLPYDVKIYPNPTEDNIEVSFSKLINLAEISIVNGLGEMIQTSIINNSNSTTCNIEHLEAGIYYMKIEIDNFKEFFKVIKL